VPPTSFPFPLVPPAGEKGGKVPLREKREEKPSCPPCGRRGGKALFPFGCFARVLRSKGRGSLFFEFEIINK